jgi:hypothetical protein
MTHLRGYSYSSKCVNKKRSISIRLFSITYLAIFDHYLIYHLFIATVSLLLLQISPGGIVGIVGRSRPGTVNSEENND